MSAFDPTLAGITYSLHEQFFTLGFFITSSHILIFRYLKKYLWWTMRILTRVCTRTFFLHQKHRTKILLPPCGGRRPKPRRPRRRCFKWLRPRQSKVALRRLLLLVIQRGPPLLLHPLWIFRYSSIFISPRLWVSFHNVV